MRPTRIKQRYRDERRSFAGTYGEESLAAVGLDAPPGISFLAVREQLLELRQRLRDPETPARLGEALSGHSPIEPTSVADALEPTGACRPRLRTVQMPEKRSTRLPGRSQPQAAER